MLSIAAAEMIVLAFGVYVLIGLVFASLFVFRGVGRIDPVAKGAPMIFRLLILPGSAALWPLMLSKWLRAGRGERAGAEAEVTS